MLAKGECKDSHSCEGRRRPNGLIVMSVLPLRRRLAGWPQPKVFAVHHNMCLGAVKTCARVCVCAWHVCLCALILCARPLDQGHPAVCGSPPSAPFFRNGWCLGLLRLALVDNETSGGACRFDTPLLTWSGLVPLVLGPGGPGAAAVGCIPLASPEGCYVSTPFFSAILVPDMLVCVHMCNHRPG